MSMERTIVGREIAGASCGPAEVNLGSSGDETDAANAESRNARGVSDRSWMVFDPLLVNESEKLGSQRGALGATIFHLIHMDGKD